MALNASEFTYRWLYVEGHNLNVLVMELCLFCIAPLICVMLVLGLLVSVYVIMLDKNNPTTMHNQMYTYVCDVSTRHRPHPERHAGLLWLQNRYALMTYYASYISSSWLRPVVINPKFPLFKYLNVLSHKSLHPYIFNCYELYSSFITS